MRASNNSRNTSRMRKRNFNRDTSFKNFGGRSNRYKPRSGFVLDIKITVIISLSIIITGIVVCIFMWRYSYHNNSNPESALKSFIYAVQHEDIEETLQYIDLNNNKLYYNKAVLDLKAGKDHKTILLNFKKSLSKEFIDTFWKSNFDYKIIAQKSNNLKYIIVISVEKSGNIQYYQFVLNFIEPKWFIDTVTLLKNIEDVNNITETVDKIPVYDEDPVDYNNKFVNNFLSSEVFKENSDKTKELFKKLSDALMEHKDVLVVNADFSYDEFDDLFNLCENSLPFTDVYSYTYYSNKLNSVKSINLFYYYDKDEFIDMYKQLIARAKQITDSIPNDISDYDKIKMIHDEVINDCIYEYNEYDQYAYGVFCKGKAVCGGYAQAFKFLCYLEGFDCVYISGKVGDEYHAWNKVKLNGKWYFVDATWDDLDDNLNDDDYPNGVEYDYFLLDDSQTKKSHKVISNRYFKIPDSLDDSESYFKHEKLMINSKKDSEIEKSLKRIVRENFDPNKKYNVIRFKCKNKDIYNYLINDFLYDSNDRYKMYDYLSPYLPENAELSLSNNKNDSLYIYNIFINLT